MNPDDIYRLRSRRIDRRPMPSPFASGISAMAGYVTAVPSVTNPFISMQPRVIVGDESEGASYTITDTGDPIIIAGVGKKPRAGFDTIAGFFPYRWANFIRSDTLCDGGYVGSVSFFYCNSSFGYAGPDGIAVTVTRDSTTIASGTVDRGVAFTFPIDRLGTYTINWSKALFQSGSSSFTITTCPTANRTNTPPTMMTDADRTCNALCPDYPLKKTLVGNDGQGDVTLTWNGAGGFWTGSAFRSVTGRAACPGTTDTTITAQVDFTWYPSNGTNSDHVEAYAYVCSANGKPAPGAGSNTNYVQLWTGTPTGSRTCWPFHSVCGLTMNATGSQFYPGGFTFDVTE